VYIRSAIVLFSTSLFLGAISSLFWLQDRQYSLPTTRPDGLIQPEIGARLGLSVQSAATQSGRPLFLHFFNPRCPCSRFTVDHIRELIRRHRGEVEFVAVLQTDGDGAAGTAAARSELGDGIEIVVDGDGELGRQTGVYATPQAVLVDSAGRLYFRGNYNLSRFCNVRETEYARIALEAMLAGKRPVAVPPEADKAIGCPLPARKRKPAAS